jgi:LAO/AO transport system kinase
LSALADSIVSGDPRGIARGISIVENDAEEGPALVRELFARSGHAFLVGVTGAPGAGKSTLVDGLVSLWRKAGRSVGVIAVDPTSPFSGGAMLGDRVRMQAHAQDAGVFIRSMATRGHLGGLARATTDAALVLDAAGKDIVAIETVGVGQDEVDIARTADVSVLVLVPGMGDEVQALKAGVMEIADVFVVNKADRPGADRLRNDVELMLGLRKGVSFGSMPAHHGVDLKRVNPAKAAREAAAAENPSEWTPPVLSAVAVKQEGIATLLAALDRHFAYLERTGNLRVRRRERMRERVKDVVERKVSDRLWKDRRTVAWLEEQLPSVEEGKATPFAVADRLLRQSGELVRGEGVGDDKT